MGQIPTGSRHFGESRSVRTSIVNGHRTTITETRDAHGNVTVERETCDPHGRSSRTRHINGIQDSTEKDESPLSRRKRIHIS